MRNVTVLVATFRSASCLIVSAALGAAAVLVLATPAQGVTCLDNVLNITDEAPANGRGNRVISPGMAVHDDTVTCARLPSLFVESPDGASGVVVEV
jgi:hypothetical protein